MKNVDKNITMKEVEDLTNKIARKIQEKKDIIAYLLETVIDLEYRIDMLLEVYFIKEPSKRAEFRKFLLEKEFFTFGNKINLLRKLNFKEKKYSGFNSDIYKKLDKIREIRNKIAHSPKHYDEDKKCWRIKDIFFDEKFKKEIERDYLDVLMVIVTATTDLK